MGVSVTGHQDALTPQKFTFHRAQETQFPLAPTPKTHYP